MTRDSEDREWNFAKYMSKAKEAYSYEKRPTYDEVATYINECERIRKHITYPLAGENWNQIEWQAQYEFGKR